MTQTLVADPPPESPSGAEPPKKKSPVVLIIALIAAGIAGAIIALILLGAAILGVRNSEGGETPFPDRVALDAVDGAPDADLVLPVEVHMISGTDGDFDAVGAEPLSTFVDSQSNATLVATISTEIGPSFVYRYNSVTSDDLGTDIELACTGIYGFMSSTTCHEEVDPNFETRASWGTSLGEDNGEKLYFVGVDSLPSDAAWVVVTTFDGYRIAAESVEEIGYVQWVGSTHAGNEAHTVVALDAAFNVIWQQSM